MKRFLTFIAPAAIVFLSVLSCKPELDNPGSDNPGSEPDLPEIDPGEYSYVLSDNTIILPAECVDLLQYVDLTQKVFNVPASVADKVSIKPGMNIVINTPTEMFPEGLLANIENVAPDDNGGFNVSYSIAPLLDCFKDINVSESNMDLTGHLQKVLDGNGNEIEFTATKSITSEKFHVVIPQVDIPVATGSTITPKIEADTYGTSEKAYAGTDSKTVFERCFDLWSYVHLQSIRFLIHELGVDSHTCHLIVVHVRSETALVG